MSSYIYGLGRQPMNITETEIRYAMTNTKSCSGASRFLRISFDTFKKYASLYKDEATGKTLFDLHKNSGGKGMRKGNKESAKTSGKYSLDRILTGKCPELKSKGNLKKRLLRHAIFEEKCDECGFDERRVVDYSVPLLLDWIDSDRTNHVKDNLRLLCYNCYYLYIGNINGGRGVNTTGF